MKHVFYLGTAFMLIAGVPASAAETVTHQYDALGRLKRTVKSGGPANGTQTTTNYDPAANRTNQTTTGAPPPPP
jgi:hypothetical protein